MKQAIYEIIKGDSPIIATAIHDGHRVRDEVAQLLALTDDERLREEDPFTATWTEVADTRVVGLNSRFEVDLNRPREKAVYIEPADAWGLQVWKARPDTEIIERSLDAYDNFYAEVQKLLTDIVEQFGHFVLFDIHSYNHRRNGPDAVPAGAIANPEVNIGTGTGMHPKWTPLIQCFMDDLRNVDYQGRHLDVRENVKFTGGHFARWIHQSFPDTGCAIAIEFKKTFMDEWTGEPDKTKINAIKQALQVTLSGVKSELDKFR